MKMKKTLTVSEQIKVALDGRSQRWLALKIAMPEDSLSKKLNGKKKFEDNDIAAINNLLKTNIKQC